MNLLRMFATQTRMDVLWYFARDSEMIWWTLAWPVFFLVLFSIAFGSSASSNKVSTYLVPGVIGAQVLNSGFWGVGVMLATFREKRVLRRVYLTPVPEWVFFASLVCFRAALLVVQGAILVAVGFFAFHVRITGNPLEIAVALALGTATFVSIGTIVGAVARTAESANNMATLLTVPLAFLSDAYIPLDRFPHQIAGVLQLLPSTQFIQMFRAVSVYGASLSQFPLTILALVAWMVAGTLISARTFRWV